MLSPTNLGEGDSSISRDFPLDLPALEQQVVKLAKIKNRPDDTVILGFAKQVSEQIINKIDTINDPEAVNHAIKILKSLKELTSPNPQSIKVNRAISSLFGGGKKYKNVSSLEDSKQLFSAYAEKFNKMLKMQLWEDSLRLMDDKLKRWSESEDPTARGMKKEAAESIMRYLRDPQSDYINLNRFGLTKLPDIFDSPLFGNRTRVTVILSGNALTELPPSFSKLTNIKYVDLVNNDFRSIPEAVSQQLFKPDARIALKLSGNKIESLPDTIASIDLRSDFAISLLRGVKASPSVIMWAILNAEKYRYLYEEVGYTFLLDQMFDKESLENFFQNIPTLEEFSKINSGVANISNIDFQELIIRAISSLYRKNVMPMRGLNPYINLRLHILKIKDHLWNLELGSQKHKEGIATLDLLPNFDLKNAVAKLKSADWKLFEEAVNKDAIFSKSAIIDIILKFASALPNSVLKVIPGWLFCLNRLLSDSPKEAFPRLYQEMKPDAPMHKFLIDAVSDPSFKLVNKDLPFENRLGLCYFGLESEKSVRDAALDTLSKKENNKIIEKMVEAKLPANTEIEVYMVKLMLDEIMAIPKEIPLQKEFKNPMSELLSILKGGLTKCLYLKTDDGQLYLSKFYKASPRPELFGLYCRLLPKLDYNSAMTVLVSEGIKPPWFFNPSDKWFTKDKFEFLVTQISEEDYVSRVTVLKRNLEHLMDGLQDLNNRDKVHINVVKAIVEDIVNKAAKTGTPKADDKVRLHAFYSDMLEDYELIHSYLVKKDSAELTKDTLKMLAAARLEGRCMAGDRDEGRQVARRIRSEESDETHKQITVEEFAEASLRSSLLEVIHRIALEYGKTPYEKNDAHVLTPLEFAAGLVHENDPLPKFEVDVAQNMIKKEWTIDKIIELFSQRFVGVDKDLLETWFLEHIPKNYVPSYIKNIDVIKKAEEKVQSEFIEKLDQIHEINSDTKLQIANFLMRPSGNLVAMKEKGLSPVTQALVNGMEEEVKVKLTTLTDPYEIKDLIGSIKPPVDWNDEVAAKQFMADEKAYAEYQGMVKALMEDCIYIGARNAGFQEAQAKLSELAGKELSTPVIQQILDIKARYNEELQQIALKFHIGFNPNSRAVPSAAVDDQREIDFLALQIGGSSLTTDGVITLLHHIGGIEEK